MGAPTDGIDGQESPSCGAPHTAKSEFTDDLATSTRVDCLPDATWWGTTSELGPLEVDVIAHETSRAICHQHLQSTRMHASSRHLPGGIAIKTAHALTGIPGQTRDRAVSGAQKPQPLPPNCEKAGELCILDPVTVLVKVNR